MKYLSSLFRILFLEVIGILLISFPQTMTALIVQIIGGMFVFSGLVPFLGYFFPRFSKETLWRPLFPVFGFGSVLLGALLIFKPLPFVTALMYLLGFILVLVSFNQLLSFFANRGRVPLRWWVFILPLGLLSLGMYVLLRPIESASLPFKLLGIGCVVYGFSEIFYFLRQSYYLRKQNREYVEFEEIKETGQPDADGEI